MRQLFYAQNIDADWVAFDEEESRHILNVLRKQPGDQLSVTNGKGLLCETEIVETSKKQILAKILNRDSFLPGPERMLRIAIAPTKQIERFEWFLEKATELGIGSIVPLICKRSERQTLRMDRLQKILIAAMKQSLRVHKPELLDPTPFQKLLDTCTEDCRIIPWCEEKDLPPLPEILAAGASTIIAIGPEGDFTAGEVAAARQAGFQPVSMGHARLRTETAGLAAVMQYHFCLPS